VAGSAGGHGRGSGKHPDPRWAPSFELVESKLHPPWPGRGMVARTALVERLLAARTARLVCVVAPPGYGKTTLLAQWAERRGARVAWVSLDQRDNDPAVLLTYLAAALDRVEPIDPQLARVLGSPGAAASASLVPRFVAGLASMTRPVTVVLDNLELLANQECLDAVAEVAMRLPSGSQLALASRARPALPEALSRPRGRLLEIGPDELAMDEREARALLAHAGVRLSDAMVAELLERTDGWPVGLYLASFGLAGEDQLDRARTIAGNGHPPGLQPSLALLSRLSEPTVAFLTRTAVLDQLSGPLCDAVLQVSGSQQVLETLAGSNQLLVPVDRRQRWYRYHQLLRELLLAELERREPALVPELHRRAADWYEDDGRPELAVDHCQAAGDADRVARLVAAVAFPAYAGGRVETARRWLRWFEDRGVVERYPRVAVLGAQMEALLGNRSSAERWAAAAERGQASAAPDRALDASVALLRSLLCRDGIARARADAATAWAGLAPDSPWRATALLMEGIGHLLDGRAEEADPILARAAEVAEQVGATPAAAAALGERALIALDRRQWAEAGRLAERAVAALRAGDLGGYVMAAFVHAVAARAALRLDDPARASEHLARAVQLRPLLTAAMPHRSVQTLLELARVYLALDDPAGARAVLRQAREIIRRRPSLGVLPRQAADLAATLDETGQGAGGASSLTAAELRLLPLLATHLTLLEIGERLYLSRNTVKTQAISIYRKLGVSSRSEAMQRVRELGLLSP
jgi:LuxR family transcriptional regulator, maltose regulon positive regulatory protein